MDELFKNYSISDTVDTLEKYKYSGGIFSGKFAKQFFIVLLTNLTTLILLTVDGFVVSRFEGTDALNSVGLFNPFLLVIGAITLILASGVNVVLSKSFGLGSRELIEKIYRAVFILSIVFIIGLTVIQIPVSKIMIGIYAVSPEIKHMMTMYSVGLIIANSVSVVNTVTSYMLIASGHVKNMLKLAILESSLNLILDLVFVALCGMGVMGAGLGTAISCTVRGAVAVVLVQKSLKVFPLKKIECRSEMKDMISNGIPGATIQLMTAITSYAVSNIIVYLGNMEAVTVISVCGIGGSIATMIASSFVQTGNSMVGILMGSEDWEVAKGLGQQILIGCTAAVGAFVLFTILFPQVLFGFYGVKDYSDFQIFSVRLYMLRFVTFAIVRCLSNMCVYCGKKRASILMSVLEAVLLVPTLILLDLVSHDLLFLSYTICGIIASCLLQIILSKTLNRKISEEKNVSRVHFCFDSSDSTDISAKLNEFLLEHDVPGNIAYRIAVVCEELGAYAGKGTKDKNINVFLSIKICEDSILMFYLDDSIPAVIDDKIKGTDLVIGNYHLLEAMSSELTYQNVSGFNNFIIRFDR